MLLFIWYYSNIYRLFEIRIKIFINIDNKMFFFKNFLYFWESVGIKVLMFFFLRDKEFQNGLDLKMLEKKINWGEKINL